MTRRAPAPIDPRGPRLNQAVLCVALLAGFVFNVWIVAPVFAVVLFLGAAFGPAYGPILRFYAVVVKPRLGPPSELEDPRPPRFAATIGVVFLVLASAAFLGDSDTLGWILALIVAGLAGLAASTGICVGCELWLMIARRRNIELVA
jgi:hypothetical protein